jgi:regulator of replication initiation timing
LIDTPYRPDAPVVPTFDAVQAVKEIGALKRTLTKLVNEKEKLREEIGALRQERADLQAKMEGM